MADVLYTLIIFPIEQVIEICFFYGTAWFGGYGQAVLAVSFAVSTAVLPVYLMADAQQRRQRETELGLEKGVSLIKSVFKGDERFMLLSAYYRQNNYHPIYALRNSIDLLIQIPFFIAAYRFLSHLDVLKGASFLFINDLGSPDGLLFGMNLLPIVMTVINVVSGMIYSKGLKRKDKVQLYAMAGVFLVLLYNSPAALVLYWTGNNVYNLVKNVIQTSLVKRLPYKKPREDRAALADNALNDGRTFALAALSLALLVGLVIPAGVISSSVSEFSETASGGLSNPVRFAARTALQAGGFLLWGAALYFLFQNRARRILTVAAVTLLVMSVMNTFVFWQDYGFLTPELVLSDYTRPEPELQNGSLAVITALSVAAYFLLRVRRKRIIISALFIMAVSFAVYGISNIAVINKEFASVRRESAAGKNEDSGAADPPIKLSRNGKNVIFLMMDRLQAQHISVIFDEKPELLKSFGGFTFYPNNISLGGYTQFGAPPLFGGYYYTPAEIQKRAGQKLKDKYDESLQTLPRIMAQNGFNVTVSNLPFTNPSEPFAKRIFEDEKNITVRDITNETARDYYRGKIAVDGIAEVRDFEPSVRKNLFQFSLFKCSPYAMRTKVYNAGSYMNAGGKYQRYLSNYPREMLKNYLALLRHPQMTEFIDDDKSYGFVAVNDLSHIEFFLQYPGYKPVKEVTDRGTGPLADNPAYHSNMLSMLLIADWLDALRVSGAWDNTRIVIVSDHGYVGYPNPLPENITLPNGSRLQRYNGLLLVKDFGADGEYSIDSTFMTGADAPSLALMGVVENPVNPFTLEPLYTDKDSGVKVITAGRLRWPRQGKYKFKMKDSQWLQVKDNIFKEENWSKSGLDG